MAFIDRFVKIPIQIYDQEEADVTGVPDYEDAFSYILPSEIAQMFPTANRNTGKPITFVYMKCGRSSIAELPMNELIKLLNQHFES